MIAQLIMSPLALSQTCASEKTAREERGRGTKRGRNKGERDKKRKTIPAEKTA